MVLLEDCERTRMRKTMAPVTKVGRASTCWAWDEIRWKRLRCRWHTLLLLKCRRCSAMVSTCHSDTCGRISWNNLNSKPAPLCCPWGWFPKSNWASAKFSPFCEEGLRNPCSTYRLSWPARNAAVTPEHYYCCRLLLSMYTRHGAFPFWSWVRWVCQRTSFRRQQLWLQTPKPLDEPQDLKRRGPPCRGMISTHLLGPIQKRLPCLKLTNRTWN